jgi:hypothetical protein
MSALVLNYKLQITNYKFALSSSFLFPILNRLPKSDPHIEHAQAGRDAAHEAAGDYGAKRGIREE